MSFIKAKDLNKIGKSIYWIDSIHYIDLKEGRIVKIKDNYNNNDIIIDYICIEENNCFFKPLHSKGLILVTCYKDGYKYRSSYYFEKMFPNSKLSNSEILEISKNTVDISSIKSAQDLKKIYEKYNLKYFN